MQCNIDARGRMVRLIAGLVACAAGLLLLLVPLAWDGAPPWLPWGGGGLLLAGGFGVFEARAGWCALRAMGFRTPV